MGCTIVAAWIDDLGIRWTSVGDSLLLLYRLPDVIRLNADHSLGSFLDEQARQNKITRSEARRNRNRNALRSALTGSKIDLIDLRSEPLELRPGDWVRARQRRASARSPATRSPTSSTVFANPRPKRWRTG